MESEKVLRKHVIRFRDLVHAMQQEEEHLVHVRSGKVLPADFCTLRGYPEEPELLLTNYVMVLIHSLLSASRIPEDDELSERRY